MVEGARLESVYAGNRIAGSNPASSAKRLFQAFSCRLANPLFPCEFLSDMFYNVSNYVMQSRLVPRT